MDKALRSGINTILTKLGVEAPEKLTDERAQKKLSNRMGTGDMPTDLLDQADLNILGALSADNARPMPQADPKKEQAYKLEGNDKEEARVEMLTAAKADFRNKQRSDARRWVPTTDQPTKGKGKAKAEKPAKEAKAKPVKGKGSKVVTDTIDAGGGIMVDVVEEKASKPKTKGKVATPTPPTVKKEREGTPAAEGETKVVKRVGGAALFKELLEGGAELPKKEVMDKLIALGVKPGTASSYIIWAKKPLTAKVVKTGLLENPWGFRIEERKAEDGTKMIRRIPKRAK